MTSTRLPEDGYVRLRQSLGDPKAAPPCPAILPVSRTTWYQGIKDGRFPKPVKLSARIAAWRVEDIRALVETESWA